MFWECSYVTKFWEEVFEVLNLKLQLALPITPSLALLGIMDDNQRSHCTKLLIAYRLYYAKKEVLMKWLSPSPPVLSSMEAMVDVALPMYKLTYKLGIPMKV